MDPSHRARHHSPGWSERRRTRPICSFGGNTRISCLCGHRDNDIHMDRLSSCGTGHQSEHGSNTRYAANPLVIGHSACRSGLRWSVRPRAGANRHGGRSVWHHLGGLQIFSGGKHWPGSGRAAVRRIGDGRDRVALGGRRPQIPRVSPSRCALRHSIGRPRRHRLTGAPAARLGPVAVWISSDDLDDSRSTRRTHIQ